MNFKNKQIKMDIKKENNLTIELKNNTINNKIKNRNNNNADIMVEITLNLKVKRKYIFAKKEIISI